MLTVWNTMIGVLHWLKMNAISGSLHFTKVSIIYIVNLLIRSLYLKSLEQNKKKMFNDYFLVRAYWKKVIDLKINT